MRVASVPSPRCRRGGTLVPMEYHEEFQRLRKLMEDDEAEHMICRAMILIVARSKVGRGAG